MSSENYRKIDSLWSIRTRQGYQDALVIINELVSEADAIGYEYLGKAYRYGRGVDQDLDQAIIWFEKAVLSGYYYAINHLIDALLDSSLEMNYIHAYQLAMGSMLEGSRGGAQVRLAKMYGLGLGTEKNASIALHYIDIALDYCPACKQQCVGICLSINSAESIKKVIDLCTGVNEKWAKYTLAKIYWNNPHVTADKKLSKYYIRTTSMADYKYKQLWIINPDILEYDHCTIVGYPDDIPFFVSVCIQNDIEIKTILDLSLNNNVALKSCIGDNSTAILMSAACYEYLKMHYKGVWQARVYCDYEDSYAIVNCEHLFIINPELKSRPVFVITNNKTCFITDEYQYVSPQQDELDIINMIKERKQYNIVLEIDNFARILRQLMFKNIAVTNVFVDYLNLVHRRLQYVPNMASPFRASVDEYWFKYKLGEFLFEEISADTTNFYLLQTYLGIGDEVRFYSRAHVLSIVVKKPVVVLIRKRSLDVALIQSLNYRLLSDLDFSALSTYIRFNKKYNESNIICYPSYMRNCDSLNFFTVYDAIHNKDKPSQILNTGLFEYNPEVDLVPSLRSKEVEGAVLLNPYVNAIYAKHEEMHNVYFDFFERLVEKLTKNGIKVYTNIYGDLEPLKGTLPIAYTLTELWALAPYFKSIVTIETGIADLLVQRNCNLSVLYPGDDGSVVRIGYALKRCNFFGLIVNPLITKEDIDHKLDLLYDRIIAHKPLKTFVDSVNAIYYSKTNPIIREKTFYQSWIKFLVNNPQYLARFLSEVDSGFIDDSLIKKIQELGVKCDGFTNNN